VYRSYSPIVLASAAAALLAACVDLTPPLSLQLDAGRGDGRAASDTGAAGGGGTLGPDAASGGAGGSTAASGGAATGGTTQTATGGAGGGGGGIADSKGDAAATGGTAGNEAGGTGGVDTIDAAADADAAPPQDVGIDVPVSVDAGLPSDIGLGGLDMAQTGGSDGPRTDSSADSGTDEAGGPGDAGADAAVAPIIISIDFVGGQPAGSGVWGVVAMDPNESAGVKRAAHWNSATGDTGTLTALVSSSSSATAASASWSVPELGGVSTWSNAFTDAPGDTRMMNGYLDPRSVDQPGTISVTDLPAQVSSGYDVYVYCYSAVDSGDTRNYQYTIGSTTYSVSQPALTTSSFPGYALASGGDGGTAGAGNYVVFRNLTGRSFTLIAQPRPSTWGVQRAPVNGIQVVYPSGF
jgi:hypothetical protein